MSRANERGRPVIVGLGNALRSDDGVGVCAVQLLRELAPGDVELVELGCAGPDLALLLEGAQRAVIIDAVEAGRAPGSIVEFAPEGAPANLRFCTTHEIGLLEALGVARALDKLPRRTVVLGVQVASTAPGRELSPAVRAAVAQVARRALALARGERSPARRPQGGRADGR